MLGLKFGRLYIVKLNWNVVMEKFELPNKLYKFCSLNHRCIKMILENKVYFASASSFNDPLDINPNVVGLVDKHLFEKIISQFLKFRVEKEMLNTIGNYCDTDEKNFEQNVNNIIQEIIDRKLMKLRSNLEEDPIYENQTELRKKVREELLLRYNRGIYCLTKNCDSNLMWSHYGDSHRGVCLCFVFSQKFDKFNQGDFDPKEGKIGMYNVEYTENRDIEINTIENMFINQEIEMTVDEQVLSRKGKEWNYEEEWRLIGTVGEQECPLELSEIIFGYKCNKTLAKSLMVALKKSKRKNLTNVSFSRIVVESGRYKLSRRKINNNFEDL